MYTTNKLSAISNSITKEEQINTGNRLHKKVLKLQEATLNWIWPISPKANLFAHLGNTFYNELNE